MIGALVIGLILEGVESGAQQRYSALASAGRQTVGQVTAYEPSNHDVLRYTFVLNGQRYDGGGSFHYPGTFHLGQLVTVVYEERDPFNSCYCDPRAELANARQTPIAGGLWLGISVLMAFLLIRTRVRRRG